MDIMKIVVPAIKDYMLYDGTMYFSDSVTEHTNKIALVETFQKAGMLSIQHMSLLTGDGLQDRGMSVSLKCGKDVIFSITIPFGDGDALRQEYLKVGIALSSLKVRDILYDRACEAFIDSLLDKGLLYEVDRLVDESIEIF